MEEMPHILSLKQAASYLGISEPTMKRRIQSKQIKAYKDGGYWKIKREWVLEYQNGLLKKAGHSDDTAANNLITDDYEHLKESKSLHIDQFSQETQDFIHQICANAIKRAIRNGTFKF